MAEIGDVRRALSELPPGRGNVVLALRSGESLRGEFAGFDGVVAQMRTADGNEEIEAAEIIGVFLETTSEGPE